MNKVTLVSAFLIALLSACATSTNPSEGGFFGGVQGLSSGEYDRRIEDRQQRLDRLRSDKKSLDDEGRQLSKSEKKLKSQVAAEKRKVNQLNKDTEALRKRIALLSKEGKGTQQQIDRITKRLTVLQNGINATNNSLDALEGSNTEPEAIDKKRMRLQKQRATLQKEYQLLLDLSLHLGQ